MECRRLTAKLRDALPICLMVDGKEVKRYKNIEIQNEIKRLPFIDFKFDVPASGVITFKIHFAPGVLPEVWGPRPDSGRAAENLFSYRNPHRSRRKLSWSRWKKHC